MQIQAISHYGRSYSGFEVVDLHFNFSERDFF